MTHGRSEIVEAFRLRGVCLDRTLREMLEELPAHRTERRGCGFTQATRFLSAFVNVGRSAVDAADLGMFEDWSTSAVSALGERMVGMGWPFGWRRLSDAPPQLIERTDQPELVARLRGLEAAVRDIEPSLPLPESRLLVRMLGDVLRGIPKNLPTVAGMPVKPAIGSCSQAEEYFLELAHGRVRRHGSVNLLIDESGVPVMIEKMNLGESHSAIVIRPVQINTVEIPAGGLCALRYQAPDHGVGRATRHGRALPLDIVEEARFLRLTTLSVPPEDRRRAFSAQVDVQVQAQMLSPLTTTLDDLREFAQRELSADR